MSALGVWHNQKHVVSPTPIQELASEEIKRSPILLEGILLLYQFWLGHIHLQPAWLWQRHQHSPTDFKKMNMKVCLPFFQTNHGLAHPQNPLHFAAVVVAAAYPSF